jgi:hypothetical protein
MRTAPKLAVLGTAVLGIAVIVGVKMAGSPPKTTEPPAAAEPHQQVRPAPVVAPTPPRPALLDASLPPTVPAAAKKPAPAKPKLLSENELMERLRKAQDTDDYVVSYDLAREGLRRFPDSRNAPEMAAMVVKSLARQGKASEARAEAEVMVNKYAGTEWAREVERHTGAHPTRNQVPPQ